MAVQYARRRHRASDHMTKIAAVTPSGACPRWRCFLQQVTDGDAELQAYLQRMAGYCLTALTREQVLFFIYGTGGNGKGVFLNTLCGVMGSYAMTAAAETFTATSHTRHLTELARLRGARLVVAQETEHGKPLGRGPDQVHHRG
jgi:putative DNA primase/helicase